MNIFKRLFIWKLIFKLLLVSFVGIQKAYPQTTTAPSSNAAYWNMNRALSGVTQSALESRGYVANDPRTYSTLRSMSTTAANVAGGAAATAAAVTLAGVTAPAWGTIVLVAAVSAVVGVAVQVALNGLINWLFRSDSKIDIGSATMPYPNCVLGDTYEYWDAILNGVTIYACDGQSLALQVLHTRFPMIAGQSGQTVCINSVTVINCSNSNGGANSFRRTGTLSKACPAGTYLNGTQCVLYTYPQISAVPAATSQTLQQAANGLPQTELNKPLNPQLLAATANTLWQQAAMQAGYSGVPYPSSNPISSAEASRWMTTNPTLWPTVGDFVAPRPVTATQPQPWALPTNPTQVSSTPTLTTSPNPTTINPSTQPLTNLGEDPVTPAPTLEATPTAQSILQPILDLLPSLRNYNASMTAGQCPRPTLNLFGQTQTLESHCKVFDDNRAVIRSGMILAFTMAALFIVLSA